MMSPRLFTTAVVLSAVGWSAHAAAARGETDLFAVGVGLVGTAGVGGYGAPEPSALTLPQSGDRITLPAFRGPALGGGLAVELRLFEVAGLELQALYTSEAARGEVERDGEHVTVAVSQPAFRVPVLVKGILPLGPWSPFLVAGPELVFYGLSETESDPAGGLRTVASSDNSVWLVMGAGVEWKTPLPAIDLRIPLALRAGINPSASSDLGDRATPLPTDTVVLDSTERYRVSLFAGAGLYF